jgi:P22_AR N-terminal domain/ORF6C domain
MSDEKALAPVEERKVSFYGDEITAVLIEIYGANKVYIPIRQLCDFLGLDWSAQRQRILRDETLAEDMTSVVITPTLVNNQQYKQAELIGSKDPSKNHYQGIFSELYRRFGVSSYKHIRSDRYEQVLSFLEDWYQSVK